MQRCLDWSGGTLQGVESQMSGTLIPDSAVHQGHSTRLVFEDEVYLEIMVREYGLLGNGVEYGDNKNKEIDSLASRFVQPHVNGVVVNFSSVPTTGGATRYPVWCWLVYSYCLCGMLLLLLLSLVLQLREME